MAKGSRGNSHTFYCMQCGQESIPLFRPAGKEKEKMHRKRMYCFHCKQEVNHVEIRNDQEKQEFLISFQNGEFAGELVESNQHIMCNKGRFL